jgi:hypothetical protein
MSTIGVGEKRGRRQLPSTNNSNDTTVVISTNNSNNNTIISAPTAKRGRVSMDESSKRMVLNFILHMVDAVKDGVLFHIPIKNKERFYTFINTLFSSSALNTQLHSRLHKREVINYYYKPADKSPWYDTYSQFIDSEITSASENDVFKIPICRLSYFQNKNNKVLYLPTIYGSGARPEALTKHRIRFSIQDSGKDATAFDPGITQLITPGSYLDPASRKSEGRIYRANLTNADFKEMGLGHIVDTLTVTGDTPLTITLKLKPSSAFGSRPAPLVFQFGANINDPKIYIRSHPDNKYLLGNATKNGYINSDRADTGEIYKFILMKICGDLLQAYYGKKKIDDPAGGITRNQICAFTSDKFFALRAALFKVPCIIQDYSAMKMGSDVNLYMFYSYGTDINTIERVNKHVCNEVIRDNMAIIKRILQTVQRNRISIGGASVYTPIAQPVMEYMTRVAENILAIVRILGWLGEDIDDINRLRTTYGIPVELKFSLNPGAFYSIINKYRASDILLSDDVKSIALATNSVFKLLPRDHPANSTDSMKDRPSQGFREFVQRVQTAGSGRTSPNIVSSTTERYLARMWRGGNRIRETRRRPSGIRRELHSSDPETAVNNTVVDALNQHSTLIRNVHIPYFVEDIVALVYPFFKWLGAYSVNKAFYAQIIRLLMTDVDITPEIVQEIYIRIHTPTTDIDEYDDGSDGVHDIPMDIAPVSEEDYPMVIDDNVQDEIELLMRIMGGMNIENGVKIGAKRRMNIEDAVATGVAIAPGGNMGGGGARLRRTRRRSKHRRT